MSTPKPSFPCRKALRAACILVALFMGSAPVVAATRMGECGPAACCGHCGLKVSATAGMAPIAGADCCRGSDQTSCNTTPNRAVEGATQPAAIGFWSQYKPISPVALVGSPLPEGWIGCFRQVLLAASEVFTSVPLYLQHGILIC